MRGILVALVLALAAACGPVPSPATVIGSPVRAETPAGSRVYLLTSQWNTMRPYGTRRSSSRPSYTHLYIDVWAFDEAAKPVWRTRVLDQRRGVNTGRALLGAAGGRLWLADGKGLLGLDLADGARAADTAAIEAANPALRGLIGPEEQLYGFDAGGPTFTSAEGRVYRLDPRSLQASPAAPAPKAAAEGVFPKARIGGGNSTYGFTRMDMRIGDRWLGLLSDAQAERVGQQGDIDYGSVAVGTPPPRTALYAGRGGRPRITALERLPEAPDFLDGHLLHENREYNDPPMTLTGPDSVLVLHRDRLGDEGRLQLSRVSGPAGKVLWTARLPIARLEAVMPGERKLMLLGRRAEPRSRDTPESVDQLVALDLADGAVSAYGFRVLPTKGPNIPASSTPPAGD